MAGGNLLAQLERTVEEWAGGVQQRQARRLRQALVSREFEESPARLEAKRTLQTLVSLGPADRRGYVARRAWGTDGVFLAALLLDEAERHPPSRRLGWARLAAQVSAASDVGADRSLRSLLEDNLGRAALMEVRALRRLGELEAARSNFAEFEVEFASRSARLTSYPSLRAERELTGGLLALDSYRVVPAAEHLEKAGRLLRVVGSEEDDADLLFAQARLDALRGLPEEAVDRLVRAPPFEDRDLRLGSLELVGWLALRTGRAALARSALKALTAERSHPPGERWNDGLALLQAGVRLLEGFPEQALTTLRGPRNRLRLEGRLVASLRAGVLGARACLHLQRKTQARSTLREALLDHFADVPATPGITEALAGASRILKAGGLDSRLLDRLDLWLLLVEASPGVGFLPDA
jgi:hypothetical protein